MRSLDLLVVLAFAACAPSPHVLGDAAPQPSDPDAPAADGPCVNLGRSYIGCEYYATVTLNDISPEFSFAAVISNPGTESVHVAIDGGGLTAPRELDIAGSGVEVAVLPWVVPLEGCEGPDHPCGYPVAGSREPISLGALVPDGAYHIVTDRPVTVYQFNPLEFEVGELTSHSNDASLLFPVNAMGDSFVVAAHDAWPNGPYHYPGFLSITATADATQVKITATAPTPAANGAPELVAGVPTTVALARGDVLQVQNYSGDLTGTIVESDRPIQVIGGHYCTTLPFTAGFCDHMEENHPGARSLGRLYVSSAPAFPPRTDTPSPARSIRYLRIIGTADDTHVAFDPPQEAPATIGRGEFVEIAATADDLIIHADQPVLVAEYMVSSTAPTPAQMIGDPSLSIAVPVEQFRRDYRFHAPPTYDRNYVNIVAKAGAIVMLDGEPVTGFEPVGTSDYVVARRLLAPGGDGDHVATSSELFGISVYGYAFASSYWYPGGLDLEDVLL